MKSIKTAPYLFGIVMVVSGLVHAVVWAITGESWEGPLSIRKPVLFGISTGLTLISLGWIQQKLKPASYDLWLGRIMATTLFIEVGFITMQYWRGDASHFNHDTTFDLLIERSITILIVIACVAILDISRRSFLYLDAPKEMSLAIRGGLVFLLISCGLGFFILFYGEHLVSLGQPPTTFGKAGVLKFPHGIVIHAIQYLPIFAWTMSLLKIPEQQRVRGVWFAIMSLATFLLYSCWQTFNGLGRYDIGLVGGIFLVVAAGFAAATMFQVVTGFRRTKKYGEAKQPLS